MMERETIIPSRISNQVMKGKSFFENKMKKLDQSVETKLLLFSVKKREMKNLIGFSLFLG